VWSLRPRGALVAALALGAPPCVGAAGPLLVNGAGDPLVWAASPIPFNPDLGPLGLLANAEAVADVTADFGVWAAVPTAAVGFVDAGPLPVDVTAANYESYVGVCGDGLNPIVFDTDGAITEDLFGAGASNEVLGFAGPDCGSFVPPLVTEASAVLNGRWLDGVDTPSNRELSRAEFNAVFVHEFGHYLNLDHTQLNLLEATDGLPGNDGLVPTMFPILVNGGGTTLHLDDVVAVSALYPAASFVSAFGRIEGTIRLSDGATPFQGAWVTARRIGDPRATAVGAASGARFFPGFPGGPPPATLRGLYELPGLPPGSYTVEVEPIDPSFVGGSSVGPLDPPAVLPGPAEFWNGADEAASDPPDDPAAAVPLAVAAGTAWSGVDVVLNAIPPAGNDDCAAPTVVAVTPFADVVDTSAATSAPSDPLQSCTFGGARKNGRSVWYRFTAPGDGMVSVSTAGSGYDTVLTVSTGACGALAEVACNDDAGGGLQSALHFLAAGGTTYLIEVTAYGTTPGGILRFALGLLEGCGNGVLEDGETCDAGAANGTDGCCSVACQRLDADGDGHCDRDDVCPATPDPDQADADGDGLGDACDLCATSLPGQRAWSAPRLVASGLADGLSGNDRLRLSGAFATATIAFDPLLDGAELELRSDVGFPRLRVALPPGPYVFPGPGWKRNASGTRWTFRDARTGGTGGVGRMTVRRTGGGVQVVVSGRRATLPVVAADAPLEATVVLGGASAGAAGACGEVRFAPPGPTCRANAAGTRLVCR
jgi:hypothetical protein